MGSSQSVRLVKHSSAPEVVSRTLSLWRPHDRIIVSSSKRGFSRAGTCVAASASFAELPGLVADGAGKATATGQVHFRGAEAVALATVVDGPHVIMIEVDGGSGACGAISG